MWKNALMATASILVAAILGLLTQIDCLIPYKRVLAAHLGVPATIYTTLFAINLFALFFVLTRVLFLKDTGRKLEHAHKQLADGTLAPELGARLAREE